MDNDKIDSAATSGALTPEERVRRYNEQTTELYAGLGEFVAKFELIVHALRTQTMFIVTRSGASQNLVQPAYAELTASPLLSVFMATYATALNQSNFDPAEKKAGQAILEYVCKRIRKLIETRNEIVHGTWFIGWASEEQTDFSLADGMKPKNTKQGVKHNEISRTKLQFDELIDDCSELSDLVGRLGGMLMIGERASFLKNFLWQDKAVTLHASLWTFKRKIPKPDSA